MRYVKKIAILSVVLVVGQAAAQKPASDTVRTKLQFLTGGFATETIIPESPSAPKGATGKGTSVITWALDSMFLLIDEQSMNSLFGQYKGHGVLGFDLPTHQFVLSMFNNFGDRPTYQGNFSADTLVLRTRVPAPKGSFDQELLWYKDGEAVKLKVLNDLGKGYVLVLEQTAVPSSQLPK